MACIVAGVLLLPLLPARHVVQGVVVGMAAVGAATLGDLSESMIKRISDQGHGHGAARPRGILDR